MFTFDCLHKLEITLAPAKMLSKIDHDIALQCCRLMVVRKRVGTNLYNSKCTTYVFVR